MMNWVKIILLGVLALALSLNANGKDTSYNITYQSDIAEECCSNQGSYLLSSDVFYAGRTLNYLLKTRKINASAAFCLTNTSNNDFQNNKLILPVIIIQHNSLFTPKIITGRFSYINPHSRLSHSKSYYVFALEKIII